MPAPGTKEDEDEDEEEEEEGDEEGEEEEEGGDPEAAARARSEVQRLLEEYYRLNYEDVVGGIPTRFRWAGWGGDGRDWWAGRAVAWVGPFCEMPLSAGMRRLAQPCPAVPGMCPAPCMACAPALSACRYKEVPADTFGLGVEEILAMDDKELNQVVGLKTLAPYRCVGV